MPEVFQRHNITNLKYIDNMDDINLWESKFEYCVYSNKLLNKLLLLNKTTEENKVDITEVKKAIYYAKKYHGNQKRQSGEPYYSHPLEVAYMVSEYLFRTDIIVTSILHDTIEDTKLTFEMIEYIFGTVIAHKVMDLTRNKADRKISSTEMVESLWCQKKYDLLLIKQFDRLHNIQTIGAKSPEKAKKIVKETIQTFIVLAEFLRTQNVSKELVNLCQRFIQFSALQEERKGVADD